MPRLLHITNLSKWHLGEEKCEWLSDGEIPVDPFYGFHIINNTMSVWIIENEEIPPRIIAALSGNRDGPKHLDYILIEKDELRDFTITHEKGDSPDNEVNNKSHLNVTEISAQKMLNFIKSIWELDEELRINKIDRIQKKDVELHIRNGVKQGWIKVESLHKNIRKKLFPS